MSCGLFECHTCTYSTEDIFNNADSALYYAKEHGKNQLAVYNELDIVNKGRSVGSGR